MDGERVDVVPEDLREDLGLRHSQVGEAPISLYEKRAAAPRNVRSTIPPVRAPGEVRERNLRLVVADSFCVTEGEVAARVEEARRSGGSRRALPAGRRDHQ
jgi:hypothetical protein